MKTLSFHLVGQTPLIMHADAMVDPFHELTREKKKLTSKRSNKTDDDLRRIVGRLQPRRIVGQSNHRYGGRVRRVR